LRADTENMAQIRARPPGWRRIALPASLVLNLFLIALILGHVLLGRTGAQASPNPVTRILGNIEPKLPPRDAAVFRQVIQDDAPRYADAAQRVVEARRRLEQQIIAEPFDPAAVRQAMVAMRMGLNQFSEAFNGPLVDALAKVSPEGRRKLVAAKQAEHGESAPH